MKNILRSVNDNGEEVITLLSDNNEVASLTMEAVYDNRDVTEIDATTILKSTEIEELKKSKVETKRLELNNLPQPNLFHKETGVIYVIKFGRIPDISDRIATDSTGSMLSIQAQGTSEDWVQVFLPYKKDGTVPESFPYTIMENV